MTEKKRVGATRKARSFWGPMIKSASYRLGIRRRDVAAPAKLARSDQAGAGLDPGGDFPATKAGKSIAFHQVHEPSGQRVRYEKVVPGIGPVDRDEILKGYEVEKGEYVLLDPEEIEKVKLESRKTLELTQFVDLADIDPIYYDKPYYVVPPTTSPRKRCRASRGAQADEEGRHRPARHARAGKCRQPEALRPGMVLETLRYADEVNRASSYFRDIGDTKPDPDCSTLPNTDRKKAGDRRRAIPEPLHRRAQGRFFFFFFFFCRFVSYVLLPRPP